MRELTIKRGPHSKNSSAGFIYLGNKEIIIEKKRYMVYIKGIENPSPGRSSVYIENILDLKTNEKIKNLTIEKKIRRTFTKYLYFLDCEMKKENQKKESLRNKAIAEKYNIKKKILHYFYKPPEQIKVDDNYTTIPTKLNAQDIETIANNKEQIEKIYSSINLKILKNFLKVWKNKIFNKAPEWELRDLFYDKPILVNLIFGYSLEEEIYKEKELKEEKTNNTDLQGKNWIIEFKTPNTSLFSKNPSRNNMSGISKELSSAVIQLRLYIKKNNRELKLIDSFTHGTLIIGSEEQINENKDKIMSWNLFKEETKIRILLFSDINKIVKNLIKMFESKIK